MRIKITLLPLLATLIIAKEKKVEGYMLVYQKGYCGILGRDLDRRIRDPADCFRLAQYEGATAFSMGRQYRRWTCSAELLEFTSEDYKQWKVCVPISRPPHA